MLPEITPRLIPTAFATAPDETSDIHIATMGVDLQITADHSGEIVVAPDFAIYVRLLPTWEELTDSRHDMVPRSELSRETRQAVEDHARQYIAKAVEALPPIAEASEPDERPGEALAEAKQARDLADQAEQSTAEAGDSDVDARGQARAAQLTAQRTEEVSRARQLGANNRLAARRERNAAIAAIRREAFNRAFAELGIRVREARAATSSARSVTAEDLATSLDREDSDAGTFVAPSVADSQGVGADITTDGTPGEVAAGADIIVRPDAGILDDQIAEPQPIPMKWRRFRLALGEFRFDCHDAAARDAVSAAFSARVLEQVRTVLGAWIGSPEGQSDAYRPNERILPSDFATSANWGRYLDALRQRRPAVLADVLPDLTGVELILDAASDFVDPARVNLRVAIENGAQLPPRKSYAVRDDSCHLKSFCQSAYKFRKNQKDLFLRKARFNQQVLCKLFN